MTTRFRVEMDMDASFEECNGEARPLTAEEYAHNAYYGCPTHPRAGLTAGAHGAFGGCRVCGGPAEQIPYDEYLAYYGNPEMHVYAGVVREDLCPCCETWIAGDSLWNIDLMRDDDEASYIDDGPYALDELPGSLRDVASELAPDARIAPPAAAPEAVTRLRHLIER